MGERGRELSNGEGEVMGMLVLLTPIQVAEILNCKPSTVYAWAKTGKIPSYKVGGLLRFNLSEIEEWVRGAKVDAESINLKIGPICSSDIDSIVEHAIASTKKPGYNKLLKGKLGQDKAQKGGNDGAL